MMIKPTSHTQTRICRLSRFSAILTVNLILTSSAVLDAHAQGHGIPVFDTTAVAKQLEQIGKLKEQLDEAKKLYDMTTQMKDSLTGITDVKDLAKLLNDKKFQKFLPIIYYRNITICPQQQLNHVVRLFLSLF